MCRWLAYSGNPVSLEELLYAPKRSLIVQSLHSQMGAEETNGDGFGIGWYGAGDTPGATTASSGMERPEPSQPGPARQVAAPVRAHPRLDRRRRPGDELPSVPPRPLALHAQRDDPRLPRGQTGTGAGDQPGALSEHRGLDGHGGAVPSRSHVGLEDDPPLAIERTIGLVEHVGHQHSVEYPFQGTIATTDGERVWAFRYSSEGKSRSLFFSTAVPVLQELHPDLDFSNRSAMRRDSSFLSRWRPSRGVERGARVVLRRRAGGPGPAGAVHSANADLVRILSRW